MLLLSASSTVVVGGASASGLVAGPPMPVTGDGQMVVCHGPEKKRNDAEPIDLLLHFHGAPATCLKNFGKTGWDAVLVVVNFRGLSAAYAQPFREDPGLFPRLLDLAWDGAGLSGEAQFRRVFLSSFSAGYGAVREILKSPQAFERIDGIVAADSIYAGLEEGTDSRTPKREQMRDFRRFARAAAAGEKIFVVSHSDLVTPYASTRETADDLLRAVEIVRRPVEGEREAGSFAPVTMASKGRFLVVGYPGTTGDDHLVHLREIHALWRSFHRILHALP
jgi:hypothetical protein